MSVCQQFSLEKLSALSQVVSIEPLASSRVEGYV